MTGPECGCQPGAGDLRLWRKDGCASRGKASAADPAAPGDYLPSGVFTDLRALGFPASGVLTNTFYVEGVRRCAASGSGRIAARLDPDGPGPKGWTELDAVRVTVLKIGVIQCNGKHMVFIHGFNVTETGARGVSAEMFKRLWQSGSKAMFTAVTWEGNATPGVLDQAAYYHADVVNAFAVAVQEAYDANAAPFVNELAPSEWHPYDRFLWATDWHKLFNPVPAVSRATGSNSLTVFGSRNSNLMALKDGWPAIRAQTIILLTIHGYIVISKMYPIDMFIGSKVRSF